MAVTLLLNVFLISLLGSPTTADLLNFLNSDKGNFTSNSTYSSNLKLLFSALSSNAYAADGYAATTTGSMTDRVYGLTLCRGDTDTSTCRSCIRSAVSDIQRLCPNSIEAIIWYDECQLRYSNQNFLYPPNVASDFQMLMFNVHNVSSDQLSRFEILTTALMVNLSDLAVRNTSRLFATGETMLTAGNIIYGLVQCVRDLSVKDCRKCLQGTLDTITMDHLEGRMGGIVLGMWCNMRYEFYRFYNGNSTLQLSSDQPPSSPSPTNVSTLNATHPLADLSHGGKKSMIRQRVAIFLSLGILLLISTIVCLLWIIKRRYEGASKSQNGQMPLSQGIDIASILKIRESNLEFLLISFSSIVEATGNFSTANKLGQGGFGSVYKGQLPEHESIAVKRLDACSGQGLEEFMNEIRLIARVQHRNLVKLLGCCIEGDEKLLVYEYMPNNSLDYHLFDPVRKEHLDWSKRISIIKGIAQGLLYLHKYSRVRIIHRDLKASNILLDPDMKPKISDFGMARIFDANTTQANTNRIVGTYGYMSPEYAMEGIFSIKSDVFSFGVLMLEIICGKRNTTFHKSGKALNLLAYAWELWNNGYWLDFVDPTLGDKILKQEVSKCIIVALMCVQENAVDRPIMSEIIAMLGSESTTLPDPKKPAFFTSEHEGALTTQNDVTLTILEGR